MASPVTEKAKTNQVLPTSMPQTILTEHLKALMHIASDCFGKVEKPSQGEEKKDSLKDRVTLNETGCVKDVLMTCFGPLVDQISDCFKANKS